LINDPSRFVPNKPADENNLVLNALASIVSEIDYHMTMKEKQDAQILLSLLPPMEKLFWIKICKIGL